MARRREQWLSSPSNSIYAGQSRLPALHEGRLNRNDRLMPKASSIDKSREFEHLEAPSFADNIYSRAGIPVIAPVCSPSYVDQVQIHINDTPGR